jgi:regulator of replication initiation timing
MNEHTILRKELRDELDSVRMLLVRIQEEVDEWREKYYHQVETTNELLYEVSVLKNRLSKYESLTDEHKYLDD